MTNLTVPTQSQLEILDELSNNLPRFMTFADPVQVGDYEVIRTAENQLRASWKKSSRGLPTLRDRDERGNMIPGTYSD